MMAMFNQADLNGEIFKPGWGKKIKDMEIFEVVRDALGLYMTPVFEEKRP